MAPAEPKGDSDATAVTMGIGWNAHERVRGQIWSFDDQAARSSRRDGLSHEMGNSWRLAGDVNSDKLHEAVDRQQQSDSRDDRRSHEVEQTPRRPRCCDVERQTSADRGTRDTTWPGEDEGSGLVATTRLRGRPL